jgi:hypothetical protein
MTLRPKVPHSFSRSIEGFDRDVIVVRHGSGMSRARSATAGSKLERVMIPTIRSLRNTFRRFDLVPFHQFGSYRLGFDMVAGNNASDLRDFIDYGTPQHRQYHVGSGICSERCTQSGAFSRWLWARAIILPRICQAVDPDQNSGPLAILS